MPPSILPITLQEAIAQTTLGVWYVARHDEPDPSTLPFPVGARTTVPASVTTDPVATANELIAAHPTDAAYLLIPGREFDRSGTRHGRGGGWYDRFLSIVPSDWIRIGVARQQDVSDAPLVRQSWDEPMDWLLIESHGTWIAYETHARD